MWGYKKKEEKERKKRKKEKKKKKRKEKKKERKNKRFQHDCVPGKVGFGVYSKSSMSSDTTSLCINNSHKTHINETCK